MKTKLVHTTISIRTLLAFCLMLCAAVCARSSAQSYKIVPNITTLPAGAYGVNIHSLLSADTSATPDVDLCVYTGYGSAAPIHANAYYSIAGGMEATFDVVPSTIQEVPPSAFTSGTFPAQIYTVPLGTTACTGSTQVSAGTAVTLTLEFPQISSLNLAFAPQQNPDLKRRLPAKVEIFGSNFVQESTSVYNTPTRVVFTAASAGSTGLDGNVDFIAPSDLVSTFPSTIPSTATSVGITVCNTAVYNYCSAPYSLLLQPLHPDFGAITATPAIAPASQFVTLSASFGNDYPLSSPSVVGAPSGQVTFTDNGTPLYSAPLVLDRIASGFAPVADSPFTTASSSPQPAVPSIITDFNKDGIPDVLYIEPGGGGRAKFPILHVLLGTVPAGQFAADIPYTGLKAHPCATLLSAAVADFNLDGYPDLALLCKNPNASNVIYTLLNRKNGYFSATVGSYGPVFGTRIAAADFDHDGKQDLVLAGPVDAAGATGLHVLLGDGSGGFTSGPVSNGLDTAPSASFGGFQIAASDLNADGFADIAILNGASANGAVQTLVQLFQNDGTGKFALATTIPTDGSAAATFFIAPIRTGQRPDLLVAGGSNLGKPGISVANNSGTANIAFSSTLTFSQTVYGPDDAVFGDFNGDGFLDVATVGYGFIQVYTGDGHGSFTNAYSQLAMNQQSSERLLAAVDENGDGYADLLTASSGPVSSGAATTTLHSYITSGIANAATPGFKFPSGVHRIVASTTGTVEIAPATAQTDVTITGTSPTIALTTSSSSPLIYGTYLTLSAAITDPTATGSVSFYNGKTLLATRPVTSDGKFAFAHFVPSPASLNPGKYSFTAVYLGDSTHSSIPSVAFPFIISPAPPGLAWYPSVPTIAYGTPLSADQLDAYVYPYSPFPTGTFMYSPPLGTVLPIGTHTLSVTFTSSNEDYSDATATASIAVGKAVPVITWPAPSEVIVDTILSGAQLNATAATPQGAALPGTFAYTPPSGTKLSVAGPQKLSVLFSPTDAVDYTSASATVSIMVGPIGISSIAPAAALLGDPATTIEVVGTGFSPTSKVQVVGPALPATAIATTYISSTRLSAIIPATDLLTVQVHQLSVVDPARDLPSNAVPFAVTAPSTTVDFSAPASISPGSQTTVIYHLAPYPAPVTAHFTITFKPSGTLPDDPAVIFVDSGLRTSSVTVQAHPAVLDLPVTFQSGTISGTLTLTLALEAGGADVTPASIQPIVIPEPVAVPGISSVKIERNGDLLTVTTRGFSNTRGLTGAAFHFTPAPGGLISKKDLNIDVNSLFSTWYANPESDPYGSLFTYTEVFNLSSDASVVGQVTVTLKNDVGASQEANTP